VPLLGVLEELVPPALLDDPPLAQVRVRVRVRVRDRVRVRVRVRVRASVRDRVGDWDRDRASPCAG